MEWDTVVTNSDFGDYTYEELWHADYYASCVARCPICKKPLDHCGSGHHINCPISEAIYVPRS